MAIFQIIRASYGSPGVLFLLVRTGTVGSGYKVSPPLDMVKSELDFGFSFPTDRYLLQDLPFISNRKLASSYSPPTFFSVQELLSFKFLGVVPGYPEPTTCSESPAGTHATTTSPSSESLPCYSCGFVESRKPIPLVQIYILPSALSKKCKSSAYFRRSIDYFFI